MTLPVARAARHPPAVPGLRERRDHARPRPGRADRLPPRARRDLRPERGADDDPRAPRGRELRGRGRGGAVPVHRLLPRRHARRVSSEQGRVRASCSSVDATRVVVISPEHAIEDFLSVVEQHGPAQGQLQRRLDRLARHRPRRRQQGDRARVRARRARHPARRGCSSIGDGRNDIDMLEWAGVEGVSGRDGPGARGGDRGRDRAHRHRPRGRRGERSRTRISRVECRAHRLHSAFGQPGRAVRAADGASLENWWAAMSRGFESHALRSTRPAYAPDQETRSRHRERDSATAPTALRGRTSVARGTVGCKRSRAWQTDPRDHRRHARRRARRRRVGRRDRA